MANNIVNFPTKPKIKFVVRATMVDLYMDKKNNMVKKKHAIISLQNEANKKETVHPITDFIFTYWKNKEYNSMASSCYETVAFLNWIFFESNKRINNLSELRISDAIQFLIHLTQKGNKKPTLKRYERLLCKLYKYLHDKGVLKDISSHEIENMNNTVFKGIIYNNNINQNKLHDFKIELIIPFIETAFYERNQIALGVYYQIFGGLRVGEVVNITKSNIRNIGSYGEFGQVIKLKNNYLREDIISTSGSGEVKNDRDQVIFPYKSLLKKLYKHHLDNYCCKENVDVLFVNRNNKAMTGENYKYHFDILKKKFIEKLWNSNDIRLNTYSKYLETMDWSTHIGRGLFSNLIAEYTDNVLEVAIARGDRNLNSSLTYMADTQRIVDKIQDELELLYLGNFLD